MKQRRKALIDQQQRPSHCTLLAWHIVTSLRFCTVGVDGRERLRGGCVSIGIVRTSNDDIPSFDDVGHLKRDSGGTVTN